MSINQRFPPFFLGIIPSIPGMPPIPPIPLIISAICGLLLISFIMFIRLPAPPNCANIFGSIIEESLPKIWLGLRIRFTLSFIPFPRLVDPTLLINPFSFLCSSSNILTYSTLVPDPFAILLSLLSSVMGASLSNSSGVIESIM